MPGHALSMGVATILRARRPARWRSAPAALRLGVRLPAAHMGWRAAAHAELPAPGRVCRWVGSLCGRPPALQRRNTFLGNAWR